MLFIISSSDPQRSKLVGTGIISTWTTLSGETDKNLDSLMKIIDSEKNNELVEENQEAKETMQDQASSENDIIKSSSWTIDSKEEVSQWDKNEKWFFARLFGRDEQEDASETSEKVDTDATMTWSQEDSSDTSIDQSNTSTWSTIITDKVTVKEDEDNDISSDTNIVKSTTNDTNTLYKDAVSIYPGSNLKTQIWKSYEIGVTMLKLNNKNFNKTLALMNKWDVVTQLTQENKYGCFEVEVSMTQQKWYVCKKYLSEVSDLNTSTLNQEENATIQTVQEQTWAVVKKKDIIPTITTPVGSYYKIAISNSSFFDVILERFTLSKWDILKQVSNANENNWCVDMKVVGTNSGEHDGKIVSICSPDMVRSIN